MRKLVWPLFIFVDKLKIEIWKGTRVGENFRGQNFQILIVCVVVCGCVWVCRYVCDDSMYAARVSKLLGPERLFKTQNVQIKNRKNRKKERKKESKRETYK